MRLPTAPQVCFPSSPLRSPSSTPTVFVQDADHAPATSPDDPGDDDDLPGSKKRRRAHNDDVDYKPPGQRRVRLFFPSEPIFLIPRQASRKVSQRTKPLPLHSLNSNTDRPPKIEDEPRLISSDLDESEDVWTAELRDYMLETQRRKKQVEKWFETNFLVSLRCALYTFYLM